MKTDESSFAKPKPDSIRLSCPVCKGVVLPLPGSSPVKALEGHLERDHWYPGQLAHEAATEASKKML